MLKTKLILVDGITGSGKSTTAHFIARQLTKNGIKTRWYYEEEKDNPISLVGFKKNKDESGNDYCNRYMKEIVKAWELFVKKIEKEREDIVYIIESFFFQDSLIEPISYDFDNKSTKEFSNKISNTMKNLNPVIIHFFQENVDKAMRRNWNRRGEQWKNWLIGREEKTPYSKKRNLKGPNATITMWNELTDISKELFNESDFQKIQIENSKQNWVKYRKDIIKFLKIEQHDEILFNDSYKQFCDKYIGKGFLFNIHEKDERLCIDAFWPNLKLLSVSKKEFEIEGFPISIKFYNYGKKKKLKISKAGCYYKEGSIAEKYIPYRTNKKELDKFCSIYWCEEDKLERKLYVRDGELKYWREEGNESTLIQITNTRFMMLADIENYLDFKLVNDKYQFIFEIKGDEPVKSLFLRI